jgi:hypothetical protein
MLKLRSDVASGARRGDRGWGGKRDVAWESFGGRRSVVVLYDGGTSEVRLSRTSLYRVGWIIGIWSSSAAFAPVNLLVKLLEG